MGRARSDIADLTNPSKWEWITGWTTGTRGRWPIWSGSLASAVPVAKWGMHITYPQMAYDAPLRQYLLTFTYTYAPSHRRWGGPAPSW
jgi:hypothetical protein